MTSKALSEMTPDELGARKADVGRQIGETGPGSLEEARLLSLLGEIRAEMERRGWPRSWTAEKVASELTADELLKEGAQRAYLPLPDDWNPTHEEIRAHDTDRKAFGYISNDRIRSELGRRGLKGRKITPW